MHLRSVERRARHARAPAARIELADVELALADDDELRHVLEAVARWSANGDRR